MKTTKKLLAFAALCVACLTANAQAWGEQKVVSVGAGFGGSAFMYSGSDATMPPVQLQVEFPTQILDGKLGIGGLLGYAGSEYKVLGGAVKYSYILFGGRGNYHFYNTDNIDVYAGLTLGYNISSAKWDGPGSFTAASASGVIWGGVIGGRYYFNEKIAANAELGYGISVLTVGLSFKL
jgi:hypothetical protein